MWPEQLCQEKTVILVCYAPCPRFAHDVRLVLRQVVQRRSRQGVDGRCPVHRGTTFLIAGSGVIRNACFKLLDSEIGSHQNQT